MAGGCSCTQCHVASFLQPGFPISEAKPRKTMKHEPSKKLDCPHCAAPPLRSSLLHSAGSILRSAATSDRSALLHPAPHGSIRLGSFCLRFEGSRHFVTRTILSFKIKTRAWSPVEKVFNKEIHMNFFKIFTASPEKLLQN